MANYKLDYSLPRAMACDLKSPTQKVEPATAIASSMKSPIQESNLATFPSKKNAFKFVNLQRHGHPATFVPSKKPRGRPVSSQKKLRAPKNPAVPPEANVPEIQVANAKECIITIDSDEDINGGFSCLINEKETGNKNKLIHDAKEATERILRKARRRKRKYDNAIIIN
ncbi:hypothetical protein CUMW_064980 [Citrus unshiu]|nr:hypothetical protein CUMW_064980 [Citrus unshiu]